MVYSVMRLRSSRSRAGRRMRGKMTCRVKRSLRWLRGEVGGWERFVMRAVRRVLCEGSILLVKKRVLHLVEARFEDVGCCGVSVG